MTTNNSDNWVSEGTPKEDWDATTDYGVEVDPAQWNDDSAEQAVPVPTPAAARDYHRARSLTAEGVGGGEESPEAEGDHPVAVPARLAEEDSNFWEENVGADEGPSGGQEQPDDASARAVDGQGQPHVEEGFFAPEPQPLSPAESEWFAAQEAPAHEGEPAREEPAEGSAAPAEEAVQAGSWAGMAQEERGDYQPVEDQPEVSDVPEPAVGEQIADGSGELEPQPTRKPEVEESARVEPAAVEEILEPARQTASGWGGAHAASEAAMPEVSVVAAEPEGLVEDAPATQSEPVVEAVESAGAPPVEVLPDPVTAARPEPELEAALQVTAPPEPVEQPEPQLMAQPESEEAPQAAPSPIVEMQPEPVPEQVGDDTELMAVVPDADETQVRPRPSVVPGGLAAPVGLFREEAEPTEQIDPQQTQVIEQQRLAAEEAAEREAAERLQEQREARDAMLGVLPAAAEGGVREVGKPVKRQADRFFGAFSLFVLRVVAAGIIGVLAYQTLQDIDGATRFLARTVVPEPQLVAWILGFGLAAMAAMLVLGFGARIAAFLLLVVSIASLSVIRWGQFSIFQPGMEGFLGDRTLLTAAAALVILTFGAGRFSIDGAIYSARQEAKAAKRG
ncbi:DoxX family protein [Tessaracoccus sp. OH4464_COT-324]|uniref:DoxX family protein n=1 Tax=Tessaracoccus sp. OH4464_COT-324 TaxID=2491059 RepID=UPI000F6411C5|nr:DoxX family protein [Tessaracoccus sp. OH4464_COT-324]RRD47098.1 DoxX family membrane protein [Tessaracoccus sp. OH4464_COT-324]